MVVVGGCAQGNLVLQENELEQYLSGCRFGAAIGSVLASLEPLAIYIYL
jgi:hypothetical protein